MSPIGPGFSIVYNPRSTLDRNAQEALIKYIFAKTLETNYGITCDRSKGKTECVN